MKVALTQQFVERVKSQTGIKEYRDTRLRGLLLRVTPSGAKSYYCEMGRGNRIFVGRADALGLSEAREVSRNYLSDYFRGIDPRAAKSKPSEPLTLGKYLDGPYTVWARGNQKAHEKNLQRLRTAFKTFLDVKLTDFSSLAIESWRTGELDRGLSPQTVRRDVSSLKACFNRAVEMQLIDVSPIAAVKRPRIDNNPKVRYLSDWEDRALREALILREERMRMERLRANEWRADRGYLLLPALSASIFCDHLMPMVLLSLNTGMRRGELFDLTWNDIDWENKALVVAGSISKSGRSRHIPLNKESMKTIEKWKSSCTVDQERVFENEAGQRFGQVKTAWGGLLRSAGIMNFRWHDMRHDFASKLVMAGVDLNTVRELLGHSDYKMTLRYAHLAPEHTRRAVEVLDRCPLSSVT